MARLSSRVRALPTSATVKADTRAKELVAGGTHVINLAAGEPDQRSPQTADDAAITAIRGGETRYGPAVGLAELRACVGGLRTVPRAADEVMISTGAKQALHIAMQALVEPGDEVLLPTPSWVSFPALIALAGGVPVRVPTRADRGFVLDPADVEAAITPRTRLLILNSPSNPTGAVIPRSVLERIGELALRHDLLIVSDEIYGGITYDGEHAASPADLGPELAARTVAVDGVSKSLAMTGWRIGWAVGPRSIISAMARFQAQTLGGPAPPNQRAALAALQADGTHRRALVDAFQRRRDRALAAIREIPGITCHEPAGAIYLFPGIEELIGRSTPDGEVIDGSIALQAWLLEEAHVALVAGAPFGADGHLRLSIAASEQELLEAIRRVGEAVTRLR